MEAVKLMMMMVMMMMMMMMMLKNNSIKNDNDDGIVEGGGSGSDDSGRGRHRRVCKHLSVHWRIRKTGTRTVGLISVAEGGWLEGGRYMTQQAGHKGYGFSQLKRAAIATLTQPRRASTSL